VRPGEPLEILRATQLHRNADRGAAVSAFAVLETRLAQLEKVAAVARQIRAETVLDLPHLDDDLTAALTELDGPS
jgi:hypothetical protein